MKALFKIFAFAVFFTFANTAILKAQNVEINYWMWDGYQEPVYKKCAAKFEAANPNIKIKFKRDGFDNYWSMLTTSFVSGTAPDVFVNHISRYPQFLENGILMDLSPMIEADQLDMSIYVSGLAEIWNKDGKQYGIPKDWDTVAFVYNKEMLKEAGISESEIQNLNWNAKDGGSFQKIVARLSVDRYGKRGDDPDFNPKRIAVYGFATGRIEFTGQATWSSFAVSNGFRFLDAPWARQYHYDDPKLVETLSWLRDLSLVHGFSPSSDRVGGLQAMPIFAAQKAAIVLDGAWMINSYGDNAGFDFGFAPVVIGPQGRKVMFNGLVDSIWSGTKHPKEAWQWVKYLGSNECQSIVGKSGVVFPAVSKAIKLAEQTHRDRGLDVSAFIETAKPETTFSMPVSEHAAQISTIITTAMTKLLLGRGDANQLLRAANNEVNNLF